MHIIYLRRVSVYCMLKYNFTKLTNFEIYLDRQIGKRFLFFIVIVDINISLRRHALRPNADHCYNGISFRDMSCRSSLDLWTYMDIKVKSVLTRGKACDVICLMRRMGLSLRRKYRQNCKIKLQVNMQLLLKLYCFMPQLTETRVLFVISIIYLHILQSYQYINTSTALC